MHFIEILSYSSRAFSIIIFAALSATNCYCRNSLSWYYC